MSLKEYNSKRNFNKTSEPKGEINKTSPKTKKFVIQYHEARAKHYDFRLEYNGVLLSWAVPKGLSTSPKDKRLAVMVEDHPLDYINFEGIIPKGNYGAGTVEIFDSGEYLPIEDMEKGLRKGHIKIVLNGKKLKGGWSLIKTDDNNWLIVKLNDDFVQTKKSKVNKLPFSTCSPQLATLSNKIPKGKDWIFEIKYDGYRMVSFVENGKVKILSRNGVDYTKKFGTIVDALKEIKQDNFIVDGEVVVFDNNGKSDFGLLQQSIKSNKGNMYYIIFDLLALNGEDLRDYSLLERKGKLERLLFRANKILMYSKHFEQGKETFDFAKTNNLEGVVAKKISSKYSGQRNDDWLKIKCYLRQEFVIIGYTTTSKNELLSALLLGYYKDNKLTFIGKVGTGFTESLRKELHSIFQNHIRKTSPLSNEIKEKNVTWLTPKFVAEIQYAELTKDRLLRQPSFIGLRNDKKPKEITLEIKE
ncbi:MAG: non-homologous end-joining DNA ligase [Christensenellales bacterium]